MTEHVTERLDFECKVAIEWRLSIRSNPRVTPVKGYAGVFVFCRIGASNTMMTWSKEKKQQFRVLHVLNTNRSFSKPMPSEEILRYLSTARRKGGYKYATATIIDTLGITPDEQQVIGLCASSETRNRNSARDQRTAAKRRDRDRQIMSLFLQGWSISEIAATGIACYNTVRSVIHACSSIAALNSLFTAEELVHILSVASDSAPEPYSILPFQNMKTQIIMLISERSARSEEIHAPPSNSEYLSGGVLWSA